MTENSPNQTSSGHDVFVSYASQDVAVANSIVETLESQGVKCWLAPRDVKAGAQYADAIVRAINDAKAFVLVMSADAVGSVHVAREVERAASKRKAIVPFRIDTAALSPEFEYFLSNSQWIEVPKLGMRAAMAKLKEAVGRGSGTSSQTVPERPVGAFGKRAGIAAAILVAVGVMFFAGQYWSRRHSGTQAPTVSAITDKSIAVLPFVDMSEKKDQEYFADGMAEEIIDLLVKIPGLKVIARTSSFQFKGKTEDLRSIGKQLGAAYVLEGSVRQSGDRLRVTAQLINSRDGTHVFSQTYDRNLSDVLKMQDDIAAALVRALQIEVSGYGSDSRPALRSTEAYTLFLQGLHAIDRYDQQGFEQAASYFQRALSLDPMFADAASGIAIAYDNLGEFGAMPPAVAFAQARRAAEQALELDPNNAIAHAMLGNIHVVYDWDWSGAEAEFKLARALAPNDSFILLLAGQQALIVGRWDDAVKLLDASLQLDPLNPSAYEVLNLVQIRRRRLDEAEAAIRRTLEISATYSFAHFSLGVVQLVGGKSELALGEFLKEPDERTRLLGSSIAYTAMRRNTDADRALKLWRQSAASDFPYSTATIYAFRGESDEAFKWLDRAYAQKDARLPFIKGEPLLEILEGDPRYKAILKKMNLPE
jgi:TolB-like protein